MMMHRYQISTARFLGLLGRMGLASLLVNSSEMKLKEILLSLLLPGLILALFDWFLPEIEKLLVSMEFSCSLCLLCGLMDGLVSSTC